MKPYEAEPLSRSIQMAKPVFPIYANNNPDYWSNPGDKGNPVHLSDIDNVGYDRRDRRELTDQSSELGSALGERFIRKSVVLLRLQQQIQQKMV